MKNYRLSIILINLFTYSLLNITSAQTFNFQQLPANNSQFGFKFLRPTFVKPRTSSTLSGIYVLSANIPISSNLNFICSIPFSNFFLEANYETWKDKTKKTGFGNIFIGAQTNSEIINNERSVYSLGLYLPSAEDDISMGWASLTNYYESHHFSLNSMTLYFNYAYHSIFENNFNFSLEIGPDILIPTEYFTILFSNLNLHYGMATGYQVNRFLINLEFIGKFTILGSDANFKDRFVNSLNMGIAWKENFIIPKLYYKKYLNKEKNNMIDGVIGIEISVSI